MPRAVINWNQLFKLKSRFLLYRETSSRIELASSRAPIRGNKTSRSKILEKILEVDNSYTFSSRIFSMILLLEVWLPRIEALDEANSILVDVSWYKKNINSEFKNWFQFIRALKEWIENWFKIFFNKIFRIINFILF